MHIENSFISLMSILFCLQLLLPILIQDWKDYAFKFFTEVIIILNFGVILMCTSISSREKKSTFVIITLIYLIHIKIISMKSS